MSVLVDQDVVGVDVSNLFLQQLKLVACPNQVVQHVPHLGLVEVLVEIVAVFDFAAEHELELGEDDLGTINIAKYL